MNEERYSVILDSSEILFSHGSPFWLQTVRDQSNAFCRRIGCIAIDEAHLLWGWQEFRKKYANVGKLRAFFADVPIMALSATITRNILEYICESLHLQTLVQLYKRTLDWPNITYMVKEIKEKGFKELDVLVPQIRGISDIPKTMLFVDKIEDGVKMSQYLRSLLPESIRKKDTKLFKHFHPTEKLPHESFL